MHHAEQVDLHHAPEICGVSIAELAHDGKRGVVEHIIQAPVSGHNVVHHFQDVSLARHVQWCRLRAPPALPNGRGDFLRLASFVDDTERRSAISLYVMAGSPLAIADYCTDEGCPPVDPGSGLGPYRNSEVLALNELGLVGHPLDSDGPKGRIAPDSERWVGKLPGGAWVVGLFNRSATTSRVKRISYRAHLGIRGKASTRDLWAHAELGPMGSYRVKLAPHESRLLKITPDATGARAAIR